MKFFVAGKLGVEGDTKEVMAALKAAGHEIIFDWTAVPYLKPYDENVTVCQKAAVVDIQCVQAADVLILLPHDRGIGMYVEFGAAIGFGIPIRVITNVESQSMFFHHYLVKKVSSVEEIVKEFS